MSWTVGKFKKNVEGFLAKCTQPRFGTRKSKDENGTEISRIEPHRFLYLIRSNLHFLVRLYRFRFRI